MGCHTWFYKKLDLPKVDKIIMKNKVIDFFNQQIVYSEQMIKENDLNNNDNIEYGKIMRFFKKRLTKINELTDIELMSDYLISLDINHSEINGVFYEKTEYGDLFRHHDYDAPALNSLEETINFIKEHNCNGGSYYDKAGKLIILEPNYKLIEEFWGKYPDGIIEFG